MKTQHEYTVTLRDGLKYGIDLSTKNKLEFYLKDSSNTTDKLFISTGYGQEEVLINVNMIISIEKTKLEPSAVEKWKRIFKSK